MKKQFGGKGEEPGKEVEEDEVSEAEVPPDVAKAAFMPAEIATGVRKWRWKSVSSSRASCRAVLRLTSFVFTA